MYFLIIKSEEGGDVMGFLTILEVSKKQSYIFKSNRLRENIGASEIIEFVTKELPQKLYNKYNGRHINSGGGSSIFTLKIKMTAKTFPRIIPSLYSNIPFFGILHGKSRI